MTIDLPGLASVRSNCKAVQRSIFERRNMRHFAGGSLAPYKIRRLLTAAQHASNVGFI